MLILERSINSQYKYLLKGMCKWDKNFFKDFFPAFSNSDALEIINTQTPYIINSHGYNYGTNNLSEISHILGANNNGKISYQLSKDDGNTWYYWNGVSFEATTGGLGFSNDITTLNTNLSSFNSLSGNSLFKFKAFFDSNGIEKVELDSLTIGLSGDIEGPEITSTNFSSGYLLPGGNHNIQINYNDIGSGVNTGSANIALYKWNGSNWGGDIGTSFINTGSISQTGATYTTNNLAYGKYKYIFEIQDNNSNLSNIEIEFYIDTPEFIINTSNYQSSIGTTYPSSEIIITVKTLGVAYELQAFKNTSLNDGKGNIIIDWDSNYGVGYDIDPYISNKKDIPNNPVIGSGTININTNGELNIYTHKIKIKSLVPIEQTAGIYQMNIGFKAIFSY